MPAAGFSVTLTVEIVPGTGAGAASVVTTSWGTFVLSREWYVEPSVVLLTRMKS
jgi:hypothetical protein